MLLSSVLTWLTSQYNSLDRSYHDMVHITQMFDIARNVGVELSDVQIMAIWFHDCVYDPKSSGNEEKSAEEARNRLTEEGVFSSEEIERIAQIILDTKTHIPSTEESKIVLDLDLSILGAANRDSYVVYAQYIRKEYDWVAYDVYKENRSKIMKDFLVRAEKGTLFHVLPDSFTGHAKVNIQWELDLMAGKFDVKD